MKKMGMSFSEPIPNFGEDLGYIAIVVRCRDRLRLLHAPKCVVETVRRILGELAGPNWYGCNPSEDYGAITFRLPGHPFRARGGKKNATLGKLFMIRLFEEMYKLGYDFIVSSKLSRTSTDHSTLLFKKVCSKRGTFCQVLCISPGNDFLFGFGSNDKMILLRCPQNVYLAIQEAIHFTSKFKVQCETSFTYHDEEIIEIKMTGEPWAALEDEFTPSRRLLLEITKRIQDLNWKCLGVANLKGFSDALFFLRNNPESEVLENMPILSPEDRSPTKEFKNSKISKREHRQNTAVAAVSLNGRDKLRLLEFRDPEIVPIISWTISHLYDSSDFKPIIGDYFGSTEFVLPDTPFFCDDKSAMSIIRSRTMICAIMSALNSRGWEVFTTFKSPTSLDLSVLLMSRCSPCVYPYSCISMTGSNQVTLIAFRPNDCDTLKMIAHQAYAPGIDNEEEHLDTCESEGANRSKSVSFTLKGQPWTEHSAYGCHGKSMLLLLLVKAEILGWRLIASINSSNKTVKNKKQCCGAKETPADVDSWFFRFVGESQRPFKRQKHNNSTSHIDCNGLPHDQKTDSTQPYRHISDGHIQTIPTHSSNTVPPIISRNSVSHFHNLHQEMNYLQTLASSKDKRYYHNGLSKTNASCPTSFECYMMKEEEENMMTTLV